ncbi:MAG: hypothetical protein SWO11_07190 [Thermodesulfobacteriota bacterium]|nr:hypothetical protein [Thermodesulfobacteriota bacterium]
MITEKNEFYKGLGLLVAFFIILIFMFMPIFKGENGLEYLDALYNSISKGSAYYIPKVKEETEKYKSNSVSLTLPMTNEAQARQIALLFTKSGGIVDVSESFLKITCDLGIVLENCLIDADMMYANNGRAVVDKYGYDEKQVLYNWWNSFKLMDKELKKQKKFKEAHIIELVKKKAVETSYNYYEIEPQRISERFGLVIFSLVFYVIYTLWYGFAIMFLFEGWGLQLEH